MRRGCSWGWASTSWNLHSRTVLGWLRRQSTTARRNSISNQGTQQSEILDIRLRACLVSPEEQQSDKITCPAKVSSHPGYVLHFLKVYFKRDSRWKINKPGKTWTLGRHVQVGFCGTTALLLAGLTLACWNLSEACLHEVQTQEWLRCSQSFDKCYKRNNRRRCVAKHSSWAAKGSTGNMRYNIIFGYWRVHSMEYFGIHLCLFGGLFD